MVLQGPFQLKPFCDSVIISDVTVLSTEPTFTLVFSYDSVLVGVVGSLSKWYNEDFEVKL